MTSNLPTVSLRALEPEDLDILYKIENDYDLWSVGATNVPYSRYMLHDYIANATGDIYTDKQVRLMIDDADGGSVGILDLVNFNPQHSRAEIGIVIQKKYRDKGYARSALHTLLRYCKGVLHIHQLYAVVSIDNRESLRLFGKLGFEQNSRLKEWLFDGDNYHDAVVMQIFL